MRAVVGGKLLDRLGERAMFSRKFCERRPSLRPIDVDGEEARQSACGDAVIQARVSAEESLNLLPILRSCLIAAFGAGRLSAFDDRENCGP
jgi:hypothetical protein